ncbi:MAG: HisS family protein [Dehalococcoidia bacterium]|jgi:histidyl-tRNA synthetase
MKIQRSKGTRDLSPQDMERFRIIESAFRQCCLQWGYQEVKTPTLEYLHLFTATGTLTPGMLSKVYSFLDWDGWSGERVVLRPDGTIPISRLYIDCMAKEKLAKLFYVANVFMFEATGKKTRERWQCGAELIGAKPPLADIELVTLALEVLRDLKIEGIELRLSHAGLIKALLKRMGLSAEEQTRMFDQILDGDTKARDKLKLKRPELEKTLTSLLELKGNPAGFSKKLKELFAEDLPECKPYIDNCRLIAEFLEAMGCRYHIDIASGRGFEYYTGFIFQVFKGGEKIGGGGRYDALIPSLGGKDVPASGFALYLERLMGLIDAKALAAPPPTRILIRMEKAKARKGFEIARRLHAAGYRAEFYLGQKEADFDWTVDINGQSEFTLTDRAKKRRTAKNADELLDLLK